MTPEVNTESEESYAQVPWSPSSCARSVSFSCKYFHLSMMNVTIRHAIIIKRPTKTVAMMRFRFSAPEIARFSQFTSLGSAGLPTSKVRPPHLNHLLKVLPSYYITFFVVCFEWNITKTFPVKFFEAGSACVSVHFSASAMKSSTSPIVIALPLCFGLSLPSASGCLIYQCMSFSLYCSILIISFTFFSSSPMS